ncbi:MAG: hypothetical protein DRP58_03050 [Spirochaetes bacterium]|nr:MAG: hypothetical protein DRP58_03050 [Spirochaetota bacterium]
MFIACASSPGSENGGELPSWVTMPPADTSDTVYFIGAGSNTEGDSAKARNLAGADVVSSITRFLGVKVSSDTTVTAKDTLDKFTSTLDQTIRETSSAQIGDFKIVESFTDKSGTTINVYLLGSYNKKALLEEQARIKAVFAEQKAAISGPEAEGDSLVASSAYFAGAVKYIEAASAASTTDIENAEIKYERNMNKAREAVGNINLYALNDNLNAFIKQTFDNPFELKITGTPGIDGKVLSGVPVRITYKIVRENGRKAIRSESVITDSNGMISFFRPPANFVGTERVTMSLDLSASLETLENVPDKLYAQLESLEKIVNSKKIGFTYNVISRAKEIATAVMIIDQDNSGAATGKTETASGILEVLTSEGFSIRSIDVGSDILKMGDESIINTIAKKYAGRFERLVFGTVGISDFQKDGDRFTVKVSGDIKVADLGSGEIIYTSGNRFKSAMGSNAASAMSTAFKQFGKVIGESMANNLP